MVFSIRHAFGFMAARTTHSCCHYYYYNRSEHSASRAAVAAYTIVLHVSLSWAVFMASFIVSPSLSFIVLVSLDFCRPLDRLPNTIPVNKSFSMHLCLIMCPMNWSFCCSIWLTSSLYSPISSSMLSFDLFSVRLTLNNLLYTHISNEYILALSFFFIAHHSDAYVAMENTSDLSSLIFVLLLIDLSFHILFSETVACFARAILLLISFVSS